MYANGGIPLKYAPDGSVALVSEPRPTQIFDGKEYVMEYALRPDVSLVKAFKADTRGNLIFRGTSQNANPDCAVAGKVVLVSDSILHSRLSATFRPAISSRNFVNMHRLVGYRLKLKPLSKRVSWILTKFISLGYMLII